VKGPCLFTSFLWVALAVATPCPLLADYYDGFDANDIWGPDPNYANWDGITAMGAGAPPMLAVFDANYSWAIDNPQWWIYKLMCNTATSYVDPNGRAARIILRSNPYSGSYGVMALAPDDNNPDPNTSNTYWDDTTNHYVLVKVYYPGYFAHENDPNYDRGTAAIIMHGHPQLWTGLTFGMGFHNCAYQNGDPNIPLGYELERYWTQHFNLQAIQGPSVLNIQRLDIDPNGMRARGSLDPGTRDPNDLTRLAPPEGLFGNPYRMPQYNGDPNLRFIDYDQMERDGFWMLMQFEIDPNHSPGDPNGKYLRGAIWPGDKYGWNGQWMLSYHLADPWWTSADPNGWYASTGRTGLMCWTGCPGYPGYNAGFPGDVVYDGIEARTAIFNGIPRRLELKVEKPQYMYSVKVAPDLRDPNDPNMPEERYYRFTDGTPIVMTAAPIGGRVFVGWAVWSDPNTYPDANFVVLDSNAVLHLVMDGDKIVEAAFGCGGGVGGFFGIGFVLALAAFVRRPT